MRKTAGVVATVAFYLAIAATVAQAESDSICHPLGAAVQDVLRSYSHEVVEVATYKHFCKDKARLLNGKISGSGANIFWGALKFTGDPHLDEEKREQWCEENASYQFWDLENATEFIHFNETAGRLFLQCLEFESKPIGFTLDRLEGDTVVVTLRAEKSDFERYPIVRWHATGGNCRLIDSSGHIYQTAPSEGVAFPGADNLFLECTHGTNSGTSILIYLKTGSPLSITVPREPSSAPVVRPTRVRISAKRLEINKTCDDGIQATNADIGWTLTVAGKELSHEAFARIPPGEKELEGEIYTRFPESLVIPLKLEIRDFDNHRRNVTSHSQEGSMSVEDFKGQPYASPKVRLKRGKCDIVAVLEAQILDREEESINSENLDR